jgi:arginine repressor
MDGKEKVSKSQAVRNYLKNNPTAKSTAISEALKKQGVTITPKHVANIKSELKKQERSKSPAAKALPTLATKAPDAAPTVNKTKTIKEFLRTHHGMQNKKVAEALTKQGIPVNASYVAAVKTQMKAKRKAVKTMATERGVGLPEIKAAISLLKLTDGLAAAREALAAAQEIRAMG